jgi:hypothetical protein
VVRGTVYRLWFRTAMPIITSCEVPEAAESRWLEQETERFSI